MSGRDGKDYKQDMLVSIRYRNDLPPPPMPPKLLDIDTGGLQQYLDPGFAASIAKREEPNIEADAEGGMPIDVIGMYGYFDGDESCIMAPGVPMPLDAEDEALMLTAEQLRAGGSAPNPNFLRKTQYMTAAAGQVNDTLRMTQGRARRMSAAKPAPMARDDKENIKRNIQKAFDLAYPSSSEKGPLPLSSADRSAWDHPVHPDPSKRHLKPVDFYPIMPDWEAATMSASSWHLLRFDKAPMPAVKGRRDDRLDTGLFMTQPDPTKQPAYDAAVKAYESDPKHYEHPGVPPITFTLFLPRDMGATKTIRTMFDSRNPEHANQELMASVGEQSKNGQLRIPYERARFYANSKYEAKPEGFQTRQMIVALTKKDQASAHYYPLSGVTLLKADRGKLGQSQRQPAGQEPEVDEGVPDGLMVLPREATAQEMYNRYMQRDDYDPLFRAKFKDISRRADAERAEEEAAGAGEEDTHGSRDEGVNGIEDDLEENGDVSMAESSAPPPQPDLVSSTVMNDDEDED